MASEDMPVSEPFWEQGLLSAHFAEYQALTTRTTYRLTLQFALWPILLITLTLLANAKDFFGPHGTVWTGAGTVQFVVIHFYTVELEIYTDIHYIETQLRPMIEAILGPEPFWRYEHFLHDHRAIGPAFWEYWPLALGVAAIAFAGYSVPEWRTGDYCGLVLSSLALGFSGRLAYKCTRLRTVMLGPV